MPLADELRKLQELRQAGAISEEEFATAKANLLNAPSFQGLGGPVDFADIERQTRQWAMILHLSQLANFLVPPLGYVAPVVIWLIKKDELPGIDMHGKNVVNWIISSLIYWLALGLVTMFGFVCLFVLVGIPLLVVGIPFLIGLLVVGIVFPIIGGIKASNGEVWKYPLTITFL